MSEDKHSKTEKPSEKKLSEAKEKGNAPRSREMTSAISLIAAMIGLYASAGTMLSTMKGSMRQILGGLAGADLSVDGVQSLMLREFANVAIMLTPFVLVVIVATLAVDIGQAGVNLTTEKLKFDLGKLNPVTGFGRLFKKDSAYRRGAAAGPSRRRCPPQFTGWLRAARRASRAAMRPPRRRPARRTAGPATPPASTCRYPRAPA